MTRLLGKVIKSYRAKRGISGEELALKASTSQMYVSKIERGEHNPSIGVIARIAAALEVPLSQLFKEVEDLEKEEKEGE